MDTEKHGFWVHKMSHLYDEVMRLQPMSLEDLKERYPISLTTCDEEIIMGTIPNTFAKESWAICDFGRYIRYFGWEALVEEAACRCGHVPVWDMRPEDAHHGRRIVYRATGVVDCKCCSLRSSSRDRYQEAMGEIDHVPRD